MSIDMVRKAFEKWLLIPATKEEAEIYADDPELLPFVAGYRRALSTIDPDAIKREACAALDEAIADLENGFVSCDRCGYEEPSTTLDVYSMLKMRRAAILATEPDAIKRSNNPPEPGDVVAWRRPDGEWQAETYFDDWPESPEEVILMRAADVKRLTDGAKP